MRSNPHRSSFGSRPLKAEPSSFQCRPKRPAVRTPKLMCVASCQWCDNGAARLSMADGRCMKATGPSAGSPDGAA